MNISYDFMIDRLNYQDAEKYFSIKSKRAKHIKSWCASLRAKVAHNGQGVEAMSIPTRILSQSFLEKITPLEEGEIRFVQVESILADGHYAITTEEGETILMVIAPTRDQAMMEALNALVGVNRVDLAVGVLHDAKQEVCGD